MRNLLRQFSRATASKYYYFFLTLSLGHPKFYQICNMLTINDMSFCYVWAYSPCQKSGANNLPIDLCLLVISIVLVNVSPLTGNLIFRVVMVFAIAKTLSTLILIPAVFKIRSSSLYTLYATKQIQTCACIRFSVKWKTGRISSVPFVIRYARSITHSSLYCR